MRTEINSEGLSAANSVGWKVELWARMTVVPKAGLRVAHWELCWAALMVASKAAPLVRHLAEQRAEKWEATTAGSKVENLVACLAAPTAQRLAGMMAGRKG